MKKQTAKAPAKKAPAKAPAKKAPVDKVQALVVGVTTVQRAMFVRCGAPIKAVQESMEADGMRKNAKAYAFQIACGTVYKVNGVACAHAPLFANLSGVYVPKSAGEGVQGVLGEMVQGGKKNTKLDGDGNATLTPTTRSYCQQGAHGWATQVDGTTNNDTRKAQGLQACAWIAKHADMFAKELNTRAKAIGAKVEFSAKDIATRAKAIETNNA